MAASTTTPMAKVRRVTSTTRPRSRKGTRISASTAAPGRTTLPTISSGPVNSFKVWNRNRKYHSGREGAPRYFHYLAAIEEGHQNQRQHGRARQDHAAHNFQRAEIGRASGRERVGYE